MISGIFGYIVALEALKMVLVAEPAPPCALRGLGAENSTRLPDL